MSSVPVPSAAVQPTNAAPLPRLFAYTTSLGLERFRDRRKRGLTTLVLRLVWLTLAWRGTGRPHHIGLLQEPLLTALLGVDRLPTAQTLHRALAYFSAHDVRAALEAAYQAELPRRRGRIWAALDWSTGTISITSSAPACIPTASPWAFACSPAISPSGSKSPKRAPGPRYSASPAPSGLPMLRAWACLSRRNALSGSGPISPVPRAPGTFPGRTVPSAWLPEAQL